jgi:hypothetical protein
MTQEAQTQEMRGVLAVVVMLLLAGVFTILFAAGHLSDKGQSGAEIETHSSVISAN